MKHIVAFDVAPYAVIVRNDSPIRTIDDLINAAKTGKISNANSGIGGAMYLQSRIMAKTLGIDYAEVPYDGTNPCILAVMNGDVTFSIADYSTVINNDQIRIVCLLSDQRISFVPDAETIVEQGYTIPFMTMRRGIVAPPDTPDEICMKLQDAFREALSDPKFLEYAENNGFQLDLLFGEDYREKDLEYYETALSFKDYL
ncbi:MAG: tripartite tricarboxylate transporter substrate-binding protein [Bullifex sp.]